MVVPFVILQWFGNYHSYGYWMKYRVCQTSLKCHECLVGELVPLHFECTWMKSYDLVII